MAKRITNTIVRLKINFSTPRRVLNTVPALLPPKTLPRPAPRAWSKTKTITAILSIICIIRIAGSHSCDKFFLAFILHPYRGACSSNDFANHNLFGFCPLLQGTIISYLIDTLQWFSQVLSLTMRLLMSRGTQYHKMLWMIAVEHIRRKVNGMQVQSVTIFPTFGTRVVSFFTLKTNLAIPL